MVRTPPASSVFNEAAPTMLNNPSSGLVFARRKKSALKGPMLHAGLFAPPKEGSASSSRSSSRGGGPGTPGLGANFGALSRVLGRKSLIVEEEDEEPEDEVVSTAGRRGDAEEEEEEMEIEEVEAFSPLGENEVAFGEELQKDEPVPAATVAIVDGSEAAAGKRMSTNLEVEQFGENNRPSSVVLVNDQ